MFDVAAYQQQIEDNHVLLYYRGTIDENIIEHLVSTVEGHILNIGSPKIIRKRVITVLLECIQNSFHYLRANPEDQTIMNSVFLLITNPNAQHFTVTSGNYVTQDTAVMLEGKLKNLHQLSEIELHQQYLQFLNKEVLPKKGGAGLGLIDIVRKAKSQFFFNFEPINSQYSRFSIQIELKDKDKV